MSINIKTPYEMANTIARKARAKRLSFNLSQQTLSENAGVSYSSLKKFERTGQISLISLLKISLALDELEKFEHLFEKSPEELPASIDDLLLDKSRKRGRE